MDGTLVLLRHGQSQMNLRNLFTGWHDPGLTELGYSEAEAAGRALQKEGFKFDRAFVSDLIRARETSRTALATLGQANLAPQVEWALRERSYGDISGLDKDEARDKWGEEQVRIWRRSYDTPPPGGESLRDTVARVLPCYCREILPCVLRGETVLVVAHGNSLRALVMVLDGLDAEAITKMEIHTGVPIVYQLATDSRVSSKRTLETGLMPGPHGGEP